MGLFALPQTSWFSLILGGWGGISKTQCAVGLKAPGFSDKDFRCCSPRRSAGLPSKGALGYKSIATGLRKHCSLGKARGQENTCVMKDEVHRWATVSDMHKSCFPICVCVYVHVCVCEYEWMRPWWHGLSHSGQSMCFVRAPFVPFTRGFRGSDEVSQTTWSGAGPQPLPH